MKNSARIAAAIEVLDAINEGINAEQALSRWARSSRYAGSKDRAAVRDYVFDVLRHLRSAGVRGGGKTGRALMIGQVRGQGCNPEKLFDGNGYGPPLLSEIEKSVSDSPSVIGDCWDMPDWIIPLLKDSLGHDAERSALALTKRAPVTLRVNIARCTLIKAAKMLANDGIVTNINSRADTALIVTSGARQIRRSTAFELGFIELQDAASQAAVASVKGKGRALDFCAGGGGKSLALAAGGWDVTAYDVAPERMNDLPARAIRGGHKISVCSSDELAKVGKFDLVFCDVPCSGSGTWRRTPEAKWAITPEKLNEVLKKQADVLEKAISYVAVGGTLIYATCSLLKAENSTQVNHFLQKHQDWLKKRESCWPVDELGDGFFCAHLKMKQ